MAIPQTFIDDLLTRIDVVELINNYVPLRKRGANYEACCPFHNEKTPSFKVSIAKQIYHCFGCGAGGNAISFLMEYDKLSFVEAIEQLAKQAGVEVPQQTGNKKSSKQDNAQLYQLMEQVTNFYRRQLREHTTAPQAIEYLKQRGLTGEIANAFAMGYAPPGWDNLQRQLNAYQKQLKEVGMLMEGKRGRSYDRFRERIMFPIRNYQGQVIGFGGRLIGSSDDSSPKYLNSPETKIFQKGKELYGLYEVLQHTRQPQRLLIVEGYLDVVSLYQHGIDYAVATLGTATTSAHVAKLFRFTDEIVFCFDGDQAGKTAAWRALESCLSHLRGERQVRFLLLPEGEDPDSFIRNAGFAAFEQQVQHALSFSDFLFDYCKQQVNLNALEGKAKLASLAGDVIRKIPPGSLQTMLWQQLASFVGLEIDDLQKTAAVANVKQRQQIPNKQSPTLPTHSPVRLAIMLLIQHPNLIQHLENWHDIRQLQIKGIGILRELVHLLQNNTQLTTSALLSYWHDKNITRALTQLAAKELPYTEEGLVKEFKDVCQRLTHLCYDQQIEALLQKANDGNLSQNEKSDLQNLLKLKQGIDNTA